MAILFDLVLIAILVFLALLGMRRGLFRSLFGWISTIVAFLLALWIGRALCGLLYQNWAGPFLTEKISSTIATYGTDFVTQLTEKLPFLSGGNSILNSLVQGSADWMATGSMDALRPFVENVLTIGVAILLFVPIMILVRLLLRLVNQLTKLPILKQVNRWTGLLFGIGEGLIVVWLVCGLASTVLPWLEDQTWASALQQSTLYQFFSVWNPVSLWMQQ